MRPLDELHTFSADVPPGDPPSAPGRDGNPALHRFLLAAVKQTAEAIVLTDRAGTILWANPAFQEITGYSPEEGVGRNPRFLKSGRHDDAFYAGMWNTILSGRTWRGRMFNRRKDSVLYQEEMTISPVCGDGKSILGFVAVKRDVTREVDLAARLAESRRQEAVARLAGGLAHEINSPIQFIRDNLEFVSDSTERLLFTAERLESLTGGLSPASPQEIASAVRRELQEAALPALKSEISEALHEIRDGLQRISGIVAAMMQFSGTPSQAGQPFELDKLVDQVVALLRPDRDAPYRLLHEPHKVGGIVISGDRGSIGSALYQVIRNAVEAVRRRRDREGEGFVGEVRVRNSEQERCVTVEVLDNGGGLPEAVRERAFEPFFTTAEVGRAKGLGLAMVWSAVVDRHRGSIEMENSPGDGLVVRITLPIHSGGGSEEAGRSSDSTAGVEATA